LATIQFVPSTFQTGILTEFCKGDIPESFVENYSRNEPVFEQSLTLKW